MTGTFTITPPPPPPPPAVRVTLDLSRKECRLLADLFSVDNEILSEVTENSGWDGPHSEGNFGYDLYNLFINVLSVTEKDN